MGSSKTRTPAPAPVPPPTAEEIAIQKQQLALMQRQVAQLDAAQPLFELSIAEQQRALEDQAALRPFILQGLGLIEEDGALRQMTEEEFQSSLSEVDRGARQNSLLALERDRKALLGELPLSEAGQRQKTDEFRQFKEAMARAGHVITGEDPATASATTTSGIQALQSFNERFGLLEDAERRGQLDSASQSVLQRLGVATDIGASRTSGLLQFPGASTGANVNAPDFGGAAGQFGELLQPFQFNRTLAANIGNANVNRAFNASRQTAANRAATTSSLIGAGGVLGGVGLSRTKIFSKRSMKKDIARASEREEDKALEMVKDMKTYTYRYRGESVKAPKRMGLMVDNAPEAVISGDGEGLDVGRMMGVLVGATRAMARRKAGGLSDGR